MIALTCTMRAQRKSYAASAQRGRVLASWRQSRRSGGQYSRPASSGQAPIHVRSVAALAQAGEEIRLLIGRRNGREGADIRVDGKSILGDITG